MDHARVATRSGDSLGGSREVVSPNQVLYHIRLIDVWRFGDASQYGRYSFFGMELELLGYDSAAPSTAKLTRSLDFTPTFRHTMVTELQCMHGPFDLLVAAKLPLEKATEQQKPILQAMITVQTQNRLARINKIHFLKYCRTGADVYTELVRVLDHVSVARPFELTFFRHNHAQAAAKIRPFAARPDVQQAQVAQFQKLETEEATWPEERKRRKQFAIQQMDFYREEYLYHHVGLQLYQLHREIMAGGQWHAYEFEKALWYYHAPTGELYAEHPMRNNEKTRQLIGGVQLRTRIAAQRLQHGTRRFLRVNRSVNTALEKLIEAMGDEMWKGCFALAWNATLKTFYECNFKQPRECMTSTTVANALWVQWLERNKHISEAEPVGEILFHVRLIDPWVQTSDLRESSNYGFFGLQIQLGAYDDLSSKAEVFPLDFHPSSHQTMIHQLASLHPPFDITVVAKLPLEKATEQQKPILQAMITVQTQNRLARINKIHFLKYCRTGADVYTELVRVLDHVSVARPFELTFFRHNHAQAAAKIRPFAARPDVQQAQVAQFQKLETEEATWPEERKRRKQFAIQQMDFYREEYLYHHVGLQLYQLHREIMAGGQWHAYEFEKALWYYHAPTGELYAEHPMRNNEKTRQLIGGVQLRTRIAAQRLQHGARQFLKRKRLLEIFTDRLLDEMIDEVLDCEYTNALLEHLQFREGCRLRKILAAGRLQYVFLRTVKQKRMLTQLIDQLVVVIFEDILATYEGHNDDLPGSATEDVSETPHEDDGSCHREGLRSRQIADDVNNTSAVEVNELIAASLDDTSSAQTNSNAALVTTTSTQEQEAIPHIQEQGCDSVASSEVSHKAQQDTSSHEYLVKKAVESNMLEAAHKDLNSEAKSVSVTEASTVKVETPLCVDLDMCRTTFNQFEDKLAMEDRLSVVKKHSETENSRVEDDMIDSNMNVRTTATDGEDDDDDDDGLYVKNWRSRLRLLKSHYRVRRSQPRREVNYSPGSARGVYGQQTSMVSHNHEGKSSLHADVHDLPGPSTSRLSSLMRTSSVWKDDQGASRQSSGDPILPWRRDGSFRSFHASFNPPMESQPIGPGVINLDTKSRIGNRKLDANVGKMEAAPKMPSLTNTEEQREKTLRVRPDKKAVSTANTYSPPKKLPYIRKRKQKIT